MGPAFHGHDVLELVADSTRPFRRDELLRELALRFGADATFFTCKAEGLAAEELLDFFLSRGRLQEVDGRLVLRGRPCSQAPTQPSEPTA